MDRDADLQWFRSFVASSRWQFAKTYVESYPHEYTLDRWGDAGALWNAVLCIEQWGDVEFFWNVPRKYFYVDHRKYWHMGDAASEHAEQRPTLINRTWIDVGRYRENAKQLGYDEQKLDRLVERWTVLLEKAKRST